jgi:hypothetical protein
MLAISICGEKRKNMDADAVINLLTEALATAECSAQHVQAQPPTTCAQAKIVRSATLMHVIDRQKQENARIALELDRVDDCIMASTMPMAEKLAFIESRSVFLKAEREYVQTHLAHVHAML